MTVAELYYGVYHSAKVKDNLSILEMFLSDLVHLPFESAAAHVLGKIKQKLHMKGRPVGPYDLQIAATAVSRGATLVTHNIGEFSHFDELLLEDWVL